MAVKKIGKGKAFPEMGQWGVEQKPDRFTMNQRIVERRPEVKALKMIYSKHASLKPPAKRRVKEREAHHQHRKDLKIELDGLLAKVYAEILKESFSDPIPLRKAHDVEHGSDLRYCLYEGIIYRFDRPDYRSGEMIRQISALQQDIVK